MRIFCSLIVGLFFIHTHGHTQAIRTAICSRDAVLKSMLQHHSLAAEELEHNEEFIKSYVGGVGKARSARTFIIPVVLHVFHYGNNGKLTTEQAQSGLDVINRDFNGLNEDWDTVDPDFDSLKAQLNIEFRLASIDPEGNSTTGIIYHEDERAMYNQKDLFEYAWDNFKYFNIYLPKFITGEPSTSTGFGYYPSTYNTQQNRDGIIYSSVRWGYGPHSDLSAGDEWASTATHEVGHWLNLYHTFLNGCDGPGDFVDDTPPTRADSLYLSGCSNNNYSCGVKTIGENYMDYNIRCKKMFTKGQVLRMEAALHLPSRINLWSYSNLVETGCAVPLNARETSDYELVKVYSKLSEGVTQFLLSAEPQAFFIYNLQGKMIYKLSSSESTLLEFKTALWPKGLYLYYVKVTDQVASGKFIIH